MAEQQPLRFCLLQSVRQLWEGGEQMPQVAFLQIIRLGWGCWEGHWMEQVASLH